MHKVICLDQRQSKNHNLSKTKGQREPLQPTESNVNAILSPFPCSSLDTTRQRYSTVFVPFMAYSTIWSGKELFRKEQQQQQNTKNVVFKK